MPQNNSDFVGSNFVVKKSKNRAVGYIYFGANSPETFVKLMRLFEIALKMVSF